MQEKQEERNLFFLYKEITCNWYPTKNTVKEVKDIDNTIFYSSAGATEHTSQNKTSTNLEIYKLMNAIISHSHIVEER